MNFKLLKILRIVSKAILILVGICIIGYVGLMVYKSVAYKPMKVRVSNVTDSSFTVSWVTDEPMRGIVYYKESKSPITGPLGWLGSKVAYDDRDYSNAQSKCVEEFNSSVQPDEEFTVDGSNFDCENVRVSSIGKYYTHHVTVMNLNSEKEYRFVVGNGIWNWSEGNVSKEVNEQEYPVANSFVVKTAVALDEVPMPNVAYGKVYAMLRNEEGFLEEDISKDSLIFSTVTIGNNESFILSTVTNSEGGYSFDKANFRDSNGNLIEDLSGGVLKVCSQYENVNPKECVIAEKSLDEDTIINILGNTEKDLKEEKKNMWDMLIGDVEAYTEADCTSRGGSLGNSVSKSCEPNDCYYSCIKDGIQQFNVKDGTNSCLRPASCANSTARPTEVLVNGQIATLDQAKKTIKTNKSAKIEEIPGNWGVYADGGANLVSYVQCLANDKIENSNPSINDISTFKGCDGGDGIIGPGGESSDSEVKMSKSVGNVIITPIKESEYNNTIKSLQEQNVSCYHSGLPGEYEFYKKEDVPSGWTTLGVEMNECFIRAKNLSALGEDLEEQVETIRNSVCLFNNNWNQELSANKCKLLDGNDHLFSLVFDEELISIDSKGNMSINPEMILSGEIFTNRSATTYIVYCSSNGEIEEQIMKKFLSTYETAKAGICPSDSTPVSVGKAISEKKVYVTSGGKLSESPTVTVKSGYDYKKFGLELGDKIYPVPEDFFEVDGNSVRMSSLYECKDSQGKTYYNCASKTIEEVKKSYSGGCPEFSFITKCSETKAQEGSSSEMGNKTFAQDYRIEEKSSMVLGTTDETADYKIHLDNTGFWEIGGTDIYLETEDDIYIYLDINENGKFDPFSEPLVPSTMVSIEKNKSDYDMKLQKGVNIVSINFFGDVANSNSFTAIDLINLLNKESSNIKRITQFSGGKWEGGIQVNQKNGEISGNNFPIFPGRGYLIVANKNIDIKIPGYKLQSSIPIAFSSGWNLVGINGYTKAYTARSIIDSINKVDGLTADNVSWWPTSKGRYEGIQVTDSQTYGLDFPISSLNGYFIRIKGFNPKDSDCKSLIWHEGGKLNGLCGNTK